VLPGGSGLPLHHICGGRAPALTEEDAQSEASECELQERKDRGEAEVTAKDEGQPLFLSTPSFMASAREE